MKNKVEKVGVFFDATKVDVNSPRFTSVPPQNHHPKTTFCTPRFRKTPRKNAPPPQIRKIAEVHFD